MLAGPVGEVAGVAAFGPDPGQPPEAVGRRLQKGPGAVPIGHGRRCDQHGQEKSERVGEQVPLATVDLMGGS